MKMAKRRTSLLALVLVLVLVLAACNGGTQAPAAPEAGGGELTIGATFYGLQTEFTMRMDNAAQAWVAENGGVNYVSFDGNYDAATQMSQVETMIAQDFDAIILNPHDAVAAAAAVELAHAAGIPVIGVNTMVQSDLLTAYVGSLDVTAGEAILRFMMDYLGRDDFNIVIIEGPMGQSAQLQRMEGIQNVMDENPNINELVRGTANWSRSEAMSLMESWLAAHGDSIDAVIAQNDEMALGARVAIEAAGLDIPAIGIDGIPDAIAAVAEGRMIASYFQNAERQMTRALELAIMAANGQDVPQYDWIPFEMITPENFQDFLN